MKKFYDLPPSSHHSRMSERVPVQATAYGENVGKEQATIIDDTFERNKAAFYAGTTPDPNMKGKPSQFEPYMNQQKPPSNRIDTGTSSYRFNKANFFGMDDM